MKKASIPCFFMLCTNRTEKECLEKGLFGDREWRLHRYLQPIKKGDIGFLLNIARDQLLGIFVAESEARLNIDPTAWGGEFPAQVKVKLIGNLQRVEEASKKLEGIVRLREIPRDPFPYKVPSQNVYPPDVTERVLSMFTLTDEIKEYLQVELPEEIGMAPKHKLDDVADLEEVKRFIYQRILAPFEDEERAYKLNLRIGGGILLIGPPGTGKTLIAEAIATHIEARFIEISPSVIIGYPGEAERKIENIFASLDKEPRAVVFLDEAEWILCKQEHRESSVMKRVIPVLLVQISKIFKQKRKQIIIVAATNKPDEIDPAFLRSGRFGKPFYVGLPDKDARVQILKIHLKDRANKLNDDEISEIAEKLEGYSGADIENIVEEAAFIAFEKRQEEITKEHIIKALENVPKSVTPEDVEKIKKWMRDRGFHCS